MSRDGVAWQALQRVPGTWFRDTVLQEMAPVHPGFSPRAVVREFPIVVSMARDFGEHHVGSSRYWWQPWAVDASSAISSLAYAKHGGTGATDWLAYMKPTGSMVTALSRE